MIDFQGGKIYNYVAEGWCAGELQHRNANLVGSVHSASWPFQKNRVPGGRAAQGPLPQPLESLDLAKGRSVRI